MPPNVAAEPVPTELVLADDGVIAVAELDEVDAHDHGRDVQAEFTGAGRVQVSSKCRRNPCQFHMWKTGLSDGERNPSTIPHAEDRAYFGLGQPLYYSAYGRQGLHSDASGSPHSGVHPGDRRRDPEAMLSCEGHPKRSTGAAKIHGCWPRAGFQQV